MKMTKRFEKKLKAFAKRNNLDTNFDWDIGWFDFLYDTIKIGAIRFVGYDLCQDKPKLERTLTEVIEQLKSWRQEIKLTEVEWDFE